jgi:hypothetical protein
MTTKKQDVGAITSAAEAHTAFYIAELLSSAFTTSTSRATKLATYYLPTTTAFMGGNTLQISDPELLIKALVRTLNQLETDEGMCLKLEKQRVEAVGEGSAIVWITLERKGIAWTNVYYFRIMESGEVGWEGGNFDGEMWALKQL